MSQSTGSKNFYNKGEPLGYYHEDFSGLNPGTFREKIETEHLSIYAVNGADVVDEPGHPELGNRHILLTSAALTIDFKRPISYLSIGIGGGSQGVAYTYDGGKTGFQQYYEPTDHEKRIATSFTSPIQSISFHVDGWSQCLIGSLAFEWSDEQDLRYTS